MFYGDINRSRRRGRLIAAMLFAAVLVRSLIPLGYMPGNALAGEYLVLCPQGLSREVASALHLGHSADAHSLVDVSNACPIGQGLQQAALPVDEFQLVVVPPDTGWTNDSRSTFFIPAFEPRYAPRAPPLV